MRSPNSAWRCGASVDGLTEVKVKKGDKLTVSYTMIAKKVEKK
jgi:hypothetical protein